MRGYIIPKKSGCHIAAVVLAAVNLACVIYNGAVGILYTVFDYFQNDINESQTNDFLVLSMLAVLAVNLAVAVLFQIFVIRARRRFVLLSVYWFAMVAAVAVLLPVFLLSLVFSPIGGEALFAVFEALICFAVIGAAVLLRNRIGKKTAIVITSLLAAVTAAVWLFVITYSEVYHNGYNEIVAFVSLYFPWFPAAPILPAAAMILLFAALKEE